MALIEFQQSDGIGTVTLNRPDKLNAFAGAMREELLAALEQTSAQADLRVLVITGAGRGFCAGGDVAFMDALQENGDVDGFAKLLEAGGRVVTALRSLPQFVIASVNGVAAGAGCNLALACDYRIASSAASFGETFIRIGLHPDWGGSWLLPRLVGTGRALEICLSGRMIGAEEAERIGMVERVVEPARLAEETSRLANTIAAMPPQAVRSIKESILAAPLQSLQEQLAMEKRVQLRLFQTNEARERIRAFARGK